VKKVARIEKGPKDDGTRWLVVRNKVPVYRGEGVKRADAERLAHGLLEPAELVQVNDGA